MSARRPALLCLCLLLLGALLTPSLAQAEFGIDTMSAQSLDREGNANLRAGSHPYEFKVGLQFNQDPEGIPEGTLRELIVDLPAGMVGNPLALPRCTGAQFEGQVNHCPADTQVGVARIKVVAFENPLVIPVYNLTPPLGVLASVGFSAFSENSFQEASLRPTDYGVRVSDITIPTAQQIQSVTETIWGVPADPGHDEERMPCLEIGGECSSNQVPEAFLTLPTSCGGPPEVSATVTSLQEPDIARTATAQFPGNGGTPEGLNGCDQPPFSPTISSQPQTKTADSATGLDFGLNVPQTELPKQGDPNGTATATAHLKDATVTLPVGIAVNASAADGLSSCSPAQIGLGTNEPPSCPDASKVGTVEVESPAVDHVLNGSVYLARQLQNPFGSLLALYIVVDDPVSGVIVKLAGKVEPDPLTGQLKTTVKQNPQLPFEDFEFNFFGGPRASLTTPQTCGTYTTTTELVPWSAPQGPTATPSDSFTVTQAPGGGPCAQSEAQLPHNPVFEAKTTEPLAGAYSPFALQLFRDDGSQRLAALSLTLPPGLSGRLAGVAQCTEAQLAKAAGRSQPGEGAIEQASPSCPSASRVGTVNVGAGSGAPLYVQGTAYLAGPYKGAPLSLAIITPAVAGPFDLGAVLVRAALQVDTETAQIRALSDPIPQILAGIPLDLRSIAVRVDRDSFTLNPTSCEAMAIDGSATSTVGRLAPLQTRFQVGGCAGLPYRPKLALRFRGATHRRAHPRLIATLTAKPGEANTAFAQVKLPPSAFLDNAHIKTICTRVQFNAGTGNGAECPSGSIYGRAVARTPLLDYPLPGTVFLRASDNPLPDLLVAFNGPAHQPIHFALAGHTDSIKGALRNTFEAAPDVPVSSFRLELFGGKRGLVEMSGGFCRRPRALVRLRAHSGAVHNTRPLVRASCRRRAR